MNINELLDQANQAVFRLAEWATSPNFYSQLGLALVLLVAAYVFSSALKKTAPIFSRQPKPGALFKLRTRFFELGRLVFPLFCIVALSIGIEISYLWLNEAALLRFAQGTAILLMLYAIAVSLVANPVMKLVFKWGLLPVAALQIFGLLDEVTAFLDQFSLHLGNINITATGVLRVLIFGSLLFWLGRLSNSAGKQVIRSQEAIDQGTREVFAKLFEVATYLLVFVLLLQVMGVNLTALAVFGGALGVGLGIGLQAIASNFISGVIILLDRSISVGDFIELDDGRSGTIRELNMRSTLLETFDGKDIMVPNESFITCSFVNWTHKDRRQRYSLNFSVAYDTDIRRAVDIVRDVVRQHEQVLSGDDLPFEYQPDCEICAFGDSGVEMLVEWWMEGIDDGKNRVGGDLLLSIFETLRENGIVIPFPQREVRVLRDSPQK